MRTIENAIRLCTRVGETGLQVNRGCSPLTRFGGRPTHEPRSSGRQSAHFILEEDQSRLTSAATWFMVAIPGQRKIRNSFLRARPLMALLVLTAQPVCAASWLADAC